MKCSARDSCRDRLERADERWRRRRRRAIEMTVKVVDLDAAFACVQHGKVRDHAKRFL